MSFLTLFSCGKESVTMVDSFKPQLTAAEIESRQFTTEVMLKMGRVGNVQLSPDGKELLYSITYVDTPNNTSYTNLYLLANEQGAEPRHLTSGNHKDYNAQWSKDGKSVYYLSTRGGKSSLWSSEVATLKAQPIKSDIDISAFGISANGEDLWLTSQVKVDKTAKDIYPEYDKANVKVYDDLMARHWDYWVDGTYTHVFSAEIKGDAVVDVIDVMPGESWDAPLAPYFDSSEITINNAGTKIAYTAKKLTGKEYAESTNSDIYLYDIASKKTTNLTEGMVGYDRSPLFSPDDTKIAWSSMERAGNESDKQRLMVMDIATAEKSYVTKNFDYNAGSVIWESDDALSFITPYHATHQICRAKAVDGAEIEIVTEGLHDYTAMSMAGGRRVAVKNTLVYAPEVFEVDDATGESAQITFINKDIFDNLDMPSVEKRMVKTTDNKEMLTWVLTPPKFDATKKYPALLYCQGGPQSVVSQFWSYRWNLALMSAEGYVVVAPNRRGLPSFGSEWLDQISGDYSGQNIKDYLSAIDDVSTESYVDKDRRACVGASYGGYSTYYLAGNHDGRFKTFISHCGMFNFSSFYLSTEELWFPNNDLGGAQWKDDATAKRSYANSPHNFVDKWDSPILIIVGQNDYRIPYTESLQAFTAARLKNLDSRLVFFEDEGHQVFKPQNSTIWHKEFFGWLNKYLN